MPFDQLTPALACEVLGSVGLKYTPADVRVEARAERWLVHLPGQRLAWFAASQEGCRRLITERRVLRLLEARCSFGAPRVLLEDAAREFDVRAMVPGSSDPWRVYAEACASVELARRLGRAVGVILAEQHARISEADVAGWLPREPRWPESRDWLRERLVRVVDDPTLLAAADAVMKLYEAVLVRETDRALVHTDVGFHNLGIDPASRDVYGLFDYDGAAWADRHHDFRYLVFDLDRDDLLDAALSVYEPIVGHKIQHDRVRLYNAACAITFLAHRVGARPDERPCGRTLAEDLRWSRHAMARVLRARN
jgi:Phosphotransferase enzyme family